MKFVTMTSLSNSYLMNMQPQGKEAHASETEDPGPRRRGNEPSSKTVMNAGEAPARVSATVASADTPSFLKLLSNLFRPGNGNEKSATSLKEALEEIIEEHDEQHGELDNMVQPEEKLMLKNMLAFGEMEVEDIMVPRADIMAVAHDISLDELKRTIVEERHTRIPVYKETLDTVVGFIHLKDLVEQVFSGRSFKLESLLRRILFVPPSMKVMDLLREMRVSGTHIAVVVDEYGGTDGLVTMEDIMEEIVGDIQDEHDEEEDEFHWIGDAAMEADARMEVEKLDQCFAAPVVQHSHDDDFDTVGGMIFAFLGRVPLAGEAFDYPTGLHITILEADARSIKRVRMEYHPEIRERFLQQMSLAGK